MFFSLASRLFSALLLLLLGLSGTACLFKNRPMPPPQIPLEDFFRNPEKLGYQLAPNQAYWAFLAPYENRRNLFIQDQNGSPPRRLTQVQDQDLQSFFWKGDNTLIYLRDFGGDENYHLFAVNIHNGQERNLTPFEGVRAEIIDPLPNQNEQLIIGLNKRNPQAFDAYRLDLKQGELELLAENPGNITQWLCDHQGQLRYALATDGVNQTPLYRPNENQAFQAVKTLNFKEKFSALFFDFQAQSPIVYALSNLNRDKLAVVRYDLEKKQEIEVLFEHPQLDAHSLQYSRQRQTPTSIAYLSHKRQYAFLDSLSQNLYRNIEQALGPDQEWLITSSNQAENQFIIRTFSDRSLGAYYFYQAQTQSLSKIAEVSPWLKAQDLAPVKPIQYRSRDGLILQGYLTLPSHKPPKNLPLIINPHGGPWARDVWGFNPEVQFLANRGYAVLQVNFRGSTGYGRKFWEASFGQWGLAMQNDLDDGLDWLVQEGIADPKRIAIYGGSYGGYATLAALAFSPDKYACGIDYVGVSNLFTFLASIPPYWEPYRAMLYEMVGNPHNPQDSARLHATSPLFHVDKIRAPLLVAQGAKDPRVKQQESDQIVQALRNKGLEVLYLLKEQEGHGFKNQENKFEFYQMMESFLAKHLGN